MSNAEIISNYTKELKAIELQNEIKKKQKPIRIGPFRKPKYNNPTISITK